MSFGSASLDLIRAVFRRNLFYPKQTDPYEFQHFSPTNQGGIGIESYRDGNMLKETLVNQDLMSRYLDYMEMESYPEISAALEIIADEATKIDTMENRTIWVDSSDETIANIANFTLHKSLEIEDRMWDLTYSTLLMGNHFSEVVVMDGQGVVGLIDYSAPQVRKIVDPSGILYGYIQDRDQSFNGISTETFLRRLDGSYQSNSRDSVKVFEPWEMVHFKMTSGGVDPIYGKSYADAARYPWKRLTMIEDAMVMYKLTRSPQRYVYYVDVGDVPPNEGRKILEQVKNDFKKTKTIDDSGRLITRASPLSQQDDLFIAKRKGERSTEVDILSGLDGQSVDDADYFKNKLISALKLPKSYLGYDETIGRGNLGQQDLRLAKTVMRVQRVMKSGIKQILQVDFSARNIDPDKIDFEVKMSIPSGALEIAEVEVQKAKMELAALYQGQNFSEYFIWSKVLGYSDEEIFKIKEQRVKEQEGGGSKPKQPGAEESVDKMKALTSKKEFDYQNRILEGMDSGVTNFDRRLKELKGLTYEIQGALKSARPRRK